MGSYKLQHDTATEERIKALLGPPSEWNRRNPDCLPNRKEIAAEDMWHWFGIWTPGHWTYNSAAQWEGRWGHLTVILIDHYTMGGGGFAVWHTYSPDKIIRYFEWKHCEHEYEGKNLGRCWNRYTCKKCGHTYEVDSSD